MDFLKLSKTSNDSNNDSYLQQAQHIWSMLDDMASNSPQSYKNFIENTLKEGREAMKPPDAHMCVRTSLIEPKKCNLFINFFSWNRIPEPKSDSDPIPVFGKELEYEKNACYVNVAFNPNIMEKYGKNCDNKEELEMLIDLAIKFVENQNKCKIDDTEFKILNSNTYGDLSKNISKLTQKTNDKAKSDLELAKEALGSMGLGDKNLPDNLLNELAGLSVDKNDSKSLKVESSESLIQELDEKQVPLYENKILPDKLDDKLFYFELKVQLPKIGSFKECDLSFENDQIVLNALNYKSLKVSLNNLLGMYSFEHDKIEAKFVKNKSLLKIKLPLISKK
ncbi:unnamed protein product [Brachionus calyciflorus]|uniref:PIH1D1/2/3 CS-like domain-containing protein n=1 Tax=Brachionus calyciflorus TaxID=104777 RepID=A0A813M9A8_9BILA|nr:unnamed protein product [Brachionus calyciflorus]